MKNARTHDDDTLAEDRVFMQRAFVLAQQTYPAPNPQVGAVVVKAGKIIGEGYHAKMGSPHAEVDAIHDAEKKGHLVDGATIYITLEPCAHLGKTPPCIDEIIFSGIMRVVIACVDRNPLVAGAGISALVRAGVRVSVGVLGKEGEDLYRFFFHYMKTQRAFVTLKAALTLDGKIAKQAGKRTQITGKEAQQYAHELRRDHDAVLVGVDTVLADNSQLSCRIPCKKQPVRIIVDSTLRIPLDARVFADSNVIIATTKQHDTKKFDLLRKKGIRFIVTKGKQVNLCALLKALPSFGILSVLVEGGGKVHASFLQKKLVDRLCFFIAPKIFGKGLSLLAKISDFAEIELTDVSSKQLGKDVIIEGMVCYT